MRKINKWDSTDIWVLNVTRPRNLPTHSSVNVVTRKRHQLPRLRLSVVLDHHNVPDFFEVVNMRGVEEIPIVHESCDVIVDLGACSTGSF